MNLRLLRFFVSAIILCTSVFTSAQGKDVGGAPIDDIEEWINAHIDEIHQMDRADWLQLDYSLSVPVLRAFTPKQKKDFWEDKLKETLRLDWLPGEREHIQQMLDWINEHSAMFESTDNDEAETFCNEWCEEGEKKFGWNKKLAYSIILCGNALKNTKGDLIPLKGQTFAGSSD